MKPHSGTAKRACARRPRVGDCFEIPLPDGRRAYGQYIRDETNDPTSHGCLVRVFDIVRKQPAILEELRRVGLLFPPVYVGLWASIGSGRWKVIGSFPVPEDFTYPLFRYSHHTTPGVYDDWQIWDGREWHKIGKLPEHCRNLEILCVWSDVLLEERIMTGYTIQQDIL